MPYAQAAEVKARAGALAKAWTRDSTPGDAEIDLFLQQLSDEIDSLMSLRGVGLPLAAALSGALGPVTADGALLLMLDATWPGEAGRASVKALRDEVAKRYAAKYGCLRDGSDPIFEAALGIAPGTHASSLWTDGSGGLTSVGPISGSVTFLDRALGGCDPGLEPTFRKGGIL